MIWNEGGFDLLVPKYNLGTRSRVLPLVPKLCLGAQLWPKLGLNELITHDASRLTHRFHYKAKLCKSVGSQAQLGNQNNKAGSEAPSFPSCTWERHIGQS